MYWVWPAADSQNLYLFVLGTFLIASHPLGKIGYRDNGLTTMRSKFFSLQTLKHLSAENVDGCLFGLHTHTQIHTHIWREIERPR